MVEGGQKPKPKRKAIQVSFAANLRRLRTERGMTQEGFAELVRFAARYIQHLESGRASVELVTLEKIKRGLGVEYEDLLKPAKLVPHKGRPQKRRR